jgi:hypothetical protein
MHVTKTLLTYAIARQFNNGLYSIVPSDVW